jgi:hypothetical protein
MKHSKLLTALMLAGLCGISEVKAKSHRHEIKALEKQRAHLQAEHSESVARLRELGARVGRKAAEQDDEVEGADDEGIVSDESEEISDAAEFKSVQSQSVDPEVAREREAEALRVKEAAKELARLDKAIRRQKAREREGRFY